MKGVKRMNIWIKESEEEKEYQNKREREKKKSRTRLKHQESPGMNQGKEGRIFSAKSK